MAADFPTTYEEHVWDVYGFLAYRTQSREEAEDLTQETFERALRAWPRFDPARGEPKVWLLTIARNTYIDSRRRRGAMEETQVASDEIDVGTVAEQEPLPGPAPELAVALGRLKRREREAIGLRFGGDLSVAQVAEILGITTANAQQILSRSLRRLRSSMESEAAVRRS